MKNPFKKDKRRELPVYGKQIRDLHGSCPHCGATQSEWCRPGCQAIDAARSLYRSPKVRALPKD